MADHLFVGCMLLSTALLSIGFRLEEQRRREQQAFALAQQAQGASRLGRAFVP